MLEGLLVGAILAVGVMASAQTDDNAIFARSVASAGDSGKIERVMARARRGEPITIAVIGGSITQGAKASTVEKRYGERIGAWWKEQFPQAKVAFVNAGIGATGSDYACQRAQRDLLVHRPDFVVAEYAVNDGNTKGSAETLEGLVRQILKQPQQPAVMLLFMMNENGGNAQEWLSKVGAYYHLPMISYRDALWPEIQSGRMLKSEVFADEVHPNDRGHEYAAEFVTRYLDGVLKRMPANARVSNRAPALPKPLFTDLFEYTRLYNPGELKPIANTGWTLDTNERCWKADQPGSVIEFEVPGTLIFTQSLRLHAAMGRARVSVDGNPTATLEGWFEPTWGGWHRTDIVARDLAPGKHRVRIELTADHAPESTGHEFKLYEIGCAEVKDDAAH